MATSLSTFSSAIAQYAVIGEVNGLQNQWVELVKLRGSKFNWSGKDRLHTMAEGESDVPCKDYQSWLAEPDESCKEFMMQQTMMRIKDPKASLDFYTRILGMRYVWGWVMVLKVCILLLFGCLY